MEPALKSKIVALLDQHRIMTIATNRPDGWPQATIVGYANVGLSIYCFISRESQKYANIMRDARVSIAIGNDCPDPLQIKGLSLAARTAIVESPEEMADALARMLERYPEYVSMPRPDMNKVAMLRIAPEIISILDYTKGFGHTDLVAVSKDDLAEKRPGHRQQWQWFKLSELT